jgi:twitching motility protein PilT
VNRIVDFFPPFQQAQIRMTLAGVLRGVVSQRLVPRANGAGRAPAIEAMVVTGRIADRIVDPHGSGAADSIEELIADGEYHGMQTFDQSLFALFKAGEVTLRAAMAAASNSHDFRVALQTAGLLPGA